MLFAQILHRASNSGVKLICKEIIWELEKSSGAAHAKLGKCLPVQFGKEVQHGSVDEEHLQQVLTYNAESKSTTPRKKKMK